MTEYNHELVTRSAPRWAWEMIDNPEATEAILYDSALLAMQIASSQINDQPITRADLYVLDAWKEIPQDTCGNPIVWRNFYTNEFGGTWTHSWSCQCDDHGYEPTHSLWIGPDEYHQYLWEMLPEKE